MTSPPLTAHTFITELVVKGTPQPSSISGPSRQPPCSTAKEGPVCRSRWGVWPRVGWGAVARGKAQHSRRPRTRADLGQEPRSLPRSSVCSISQGCGSASNIRSSSGVGSGRLLRNHMRSVSSSLLTKDNCKHQYNQISDGLGHFTAPPLFPGQQLKECGLMT